MGYAVAMLEKIGLVGAVMIIALAKRDQLEVALLGAEPQYLGLYSRMPASPNNNQHNCPSGESREMAWKREAKQLECIQRQR